MARRGFLDYVLGGAVGGLEGLAQKRAAEEERKRMADAAALDQARFLMQAGFRVAPDAYDTEDPAARSVLPPLEMPSASAPPSATRASGALSAALNRGFGVDATKPSLSRPSFGSAPLALDSRTTRMTEVLGRGQEARAAQEAIAASVNLGGGQKVRFLAPESAAQVASRTRTEYETKKEVDRLSAAKGKAEERKALDDNARELAKIYVSSYTKNGKPMPYAEAYASAMQGKNPIESGFLSKPMSEQEKQALVISEGNLNVSRGNLAVSQDRLTLDKTNATQTKAQKAAALAAAKKAANDVLPTVIAASNAVSNWGEKEVKSLDPFRIAAQNAAVLEGGLWGAIKSKALSKTGITDLDKQYLQYASAVADAVARASEVGVLTNQDINRFRSQVSFDGGENETQIRFKLANLKSWASWLANSKKNIDAADGDINTLSSNYGSAAKIPGETDKEYESRTGKSATGANANPYR